MLRFELSRERTEASGRLLETLSPKLNVATRVEPGGPCWTWRNLLNLEKLVEPREICGLRRGSGNLVVGRALMCLGLARSRLWRRRAS